MQAQHNPVIMLRKSKYKTIKDLRKKVSASQSAIQKLWKLKEKEKKFWKKGLCEKEVGWCKLHRNFCDIDSSCKPWDPIPASSPEGGIKDIKKRCFWSCLSKKMPPHPPNTLINDLTFSRCVHCTKRYPLETTSKVSESFGAVQFRENLGVSSAENSSRGHEDDQMQKKCDVAFHILQSISSPEVNSWGHV